MKELILSRLIPLAVALYLVHWLRHNCKTHDRQDIPLKVHQAFQTWKMQYKKVYSTPAEDSYRLGVYFSNYVVVQMHSDSRYQVELNQFADLTPEEFESKYTGYKPGPKPEIKGSPSASIPEAYPAQWDWRTQNVLPPVQDQGQCNSSWAFAATATFTATAKIAGFNLYQFSAQQLIDCSRMYKNTGCQGGDALWAFEYIGYQSGLETEAQYPYKGVDQTCQANKSLNQPPQISRVQPSRGTCESLYDCYQQPMTVMINANGITFYKSGIYSNAKCGKNTNYQSVLVGYGTDPSTKQNYWIVRNSWGPNWGENGYILMDRDVDIVDGICGICQVSHGIEVYAPKPSHH